MPRLLMVVLAAALAMHAPVSFPPRIAGQASQPTARGTTAETIDRIMAVVGGQPITLSDVQAAILFGFVPPAPPSATDPLVFALDHVVERALILTEVERYQPPEPAPEAIAARFAEIQQKFPTPQAFEAALRDTGLTVDQLRRDIRDDLRMQTYLNQRFGAGDAQTRARLESDWLASLHKRTEVTVLYLGK